MFNMRFILIDTLLEYFVFFDNLKLFLAKISLCLNVCFLHHNANIYTVFFG